jgi:hypothetical protein
VIFVLSIPRQSGGQNFIARIKDLDLLGACILIPAVVCLLLALQWGGSTYPWDNSRIIGLFVGFGCLIIIFIFAQLRIGDRATLPPRILAQRTMAAAVCFATMFEAAFFVLVFYLPLYFQSVKGVSATKSGINVLPLLLATVISSVITGALITAVGYYTPFLIAGAIIFSIGSGLISTYKIDMPFSKWFGYQVLAGAGVGGGFQIPIIAVQTVLPLEDVPVGTACVIFFQSLGSALFISVGQTVFQNGLIRGTRGVCSKFEPRDLVKGGGYRDKERLGEGGDVGRAAGSAECVHGGLDLQF